MQLEPRVKSFLRRGKTELHKPPCPCWWGRWNFVAEP
jgi:hypothetical protein